MTKRIIVALLISMFAISAYCAPKGRGTGPRDGSGFKGGSGTRPNFVDANNDGICDLR